MSESASNPPRTPPTEQLDSLGLLSGAAAYIFWGFAAIYWKWMGHLGTWEIQGHRMIWSFVVIVSIIAMTGRTARVLEILRDWSRLKYLIVSAFLVTGNWSIFIYAVTHDQVLQASLGYFINPLVSILLGYALLREYLNRRQMTAIGFAAFGVSVLLVSAGVFPWIALSLAISFALYGYVRKVVNVGALEGLCVELLVVLPLGIALLFFLESQGSASLWDLPLQDLLLFFGAGVVTFIPLALFNEGARRLPLTAVGFLQYIAPTIQFFLAIWMFGEIFTKAHGVTFGLIWIGLAIYSFDAIATERALRRRPV